jgi:hypothetical protein
LGESGYRKFKGQQFECIVDIGEIGASYQPGHAHADTFNFVLNVDNSNFVVDTSISTYENNPVRYYERSTRAHNTVEYGGFDQSEVWSAFRVGARAHVKQSNSVDNCFSAVHDGYKNHGIYHERTFRFAQGVVEIEDRLFGSSKNLKGIAFIHLAEDVFVSLNDDIVSSKFGIFKFYGIYKLTIEEYWRAKGFNLRVNAKCIKVEFCNSLTTEILIKSDI